ncbi:MAG TPA: hypothetical protein VLI04_13615 [Nocardioidaceae bacterium]|nr:hypothetical protein [Nocardioidaceae bacterium]
MRHWTETVQAGPVTDPDLIARLRLEVGRFRVAERRRIFDPTLSVGSPAGDRVSLTVPTRMLEHADREGRSELVAALLEIAPEGTDTAWTSRAGDPAPVDDDLTWMAGADAAFRASGLALASFYVITRDGWVDPRSGERRVWKRLRLDP